MDFARKQLEKYGWSDGKGLGKHENGISEPIKPKLKRSAAGIGHDPASEFNEHWWTALYDKAAGNVEIKEKNGKTKKIKTKDDFQITNSTWKLKQKPKDEENEEQYSDFFVRTAVLTNGGSKVEKVRESESEGEEEKRDVFKMTDEELFKACEGRTAHKGARHGLKATGKLARIAQQEALLLTESRFNGYSHVKKLKDKVVEEMTLNSDSEVTEPKKKKKKRKRCNSNEKQNENIQGDCDMAESNEVPLPADEMIQDDNDTSVIKEVNFSKKSKKSKRKDFSNIEVIQEEDESMVPKKKKKQKDEVESEEAVQEETDTIEVVNTKKSKKKKKRDVDS
ncbi:G patch domain-containing protein 4 [Anticarsia gemmatalis]|uniref:G patch domain-containing protein 4 n=1 Tax=Anticarsia gemmatalis TaxID=129554 RepID=UPI003F7710C4